MENEIIHFSIPELSFHIRTLSMGVGVRYRDSHRHNAVELICTEGGPICCRLEGKALTVQPGQILLINTQAVHSLQPIASGKLTYIQIDMNKYDTPLYENSCIDAFMVRSQERSYGIFDSDHELGQLFHRMQREVEEKKTGYSSFIRACIFHLAAVMQREGLTVPISAATAEMLEKVLPVVVYIESHYAQKLTLEELGAQIGCDKYRLCHLFKKGTGGSAVDYCNFVRLQKAEQLLRNSQQNVSEIAFSCGFASLQYFNRVFRQQRGCSPSVYRKQCNQI